MVVVDLDGNIVEGDLRPSSDTATHLRYTKHLLILAVLYIHIRRGQQLGHRLANRSQHLGLPMQTIFTVKFRLHVRFCRKKSKRHMKWRLEISLSTLFKVWI